LHSSFDHCKGTASFCHAGFYPGPEIQVLHGARAVEGHASAILEQKSMLLQGKGGCINFNQWKLELESSLVSDRTNRTKRSLPKALASMHPASW